MLPRDNIQELFNYVRTALNKEPAIVSEEITSKLHISTRRADRVLHLIVLNYSDDETAKSSYLTGEIEVFGFRVVCEQIYWKYASKEIGKLPRTSIVLAIIDPSCASNKVKNHLAAFAREIPLVLLSNCLADVNTFKSRFSAGWEVILFKEELFYVSQIEALLSQHLNEKRIEMLYYKSFLLLLDDLIDRWRRKRIGTLEDIKSQQQQLELQIHHFNGRFPQKIKQEFTDLLLGFKKEAAAFEKGIQQNWEQNTEFATAPLWIDLRNRVDAIEELQELSSLSVSS